LIKKRPVLIKRKPVLIKKRRILIKKRPVVIKKRPVVIKKRPVLIKKRPILIKKRPVVIKKKTTLIKKRPIIIKKKTVVVKPVPPKPKAEPHHNKCVEIIRSHCFKHPLRNVPWCLWQKWFCYAGPTTRKYMGKFIPWLNWSKVQSWNTVFCNRNFIQS